MGKAATGWALGPFLKTQKLLTRRLSWTSPEPILSSLPTQTALPKEFLNLLDLT